MSRLTCFVISPIASKESQIRKNTNDLVDLIIEPALEKYDFNIIRADTLLNEPIINNEIINYVQNSDLCIIDLTGQDPNIMYELGRRHETNRPFVLLVKEGDHLSFAMNNIQTIFYNFDSPRDVRNVILTIQSFMEKYFEEGFHPNASGESLSAIAEALRRIEKKIDVFDPNKEFLNISSEYCNNEILYKIPPREAFLLSLKEKNIKLGEALLNRLKNIMSHDQFIEDVVEPLCCQGSLTALNILEENLDFLRTVEVERQIRSVGCMVSCYQLADKEERGIGILEPFIEDMFFSCETDKQKASVLNQKTRLLHAVIPIEEVVEICETVIHLDNTNEDYYFNAAMNYYAIENYYKAEKYIKRCLEIKDTDEDHLYLAVKVFRNCNNKEMEDKAMERFKEINPHKWRLLLR